MYRSNIDLQIPHVEVLMIFLSVFLTNHDGRAVDPEVVLELPPLGRQLIARTHRDEPVELN